MQELRVLCPLYPHHLVHHRLPHHLRRLPPHHHHLLLRRRHCPSFRANRRHSPVLLSPSPPVPLFLFRITVRQLNGLGCCFRVLAAVPAPTRSLAVDHLDRILDLSFSLDDSRSLQVMVLDVAIWILVGQLGLQCCFHQRIEQRLLLFIAPILPRFPDGKSLLL